jgi:hypothetical protein
MTKYEPLMEYLSAYAGDQVTLAFTEVERIIGSKLPDSSWNHEPHWRGRTPGRPGGAITAAGWRVEHVDRLRGSITLLRGGSASWSLAGNTSAAHPFGQGVGGNSWQAFEERARGYFSSLWNTDLRARDVVVGTGRKKFDMVSEDLQIVGDAKSFSDTSGASGKLSGIAEYVLFLQAVPARRRFLVFERRLVADEFLRRWRGVIGDVDFYLLEGDRHEVLHAGGGPSDADDTDTESP